MEKHIKMKNEEVLETIKEYKNKSNKDILNAMDFLMGDFEKTKSLILKLTHHLDSTETNYNKLLEEINKRVNNVG